MQPQCQESFFTNGPERPRSLLFNGNHQVALFGHIEMSTHSRSYLGGIALQYRVNTNVSGPLCPQCPRAGHNSDTRSLTPSRCCPSLQHLALRHAPPDMKSETSTALDLVVELLARKTASFSPSVKSCIFLDRDRRFVVSFVRRNPIATHLTIQSRPEVGKHHLLVASFSNDTDTTDREPNRSPCYAVASPCGIDLCCKRAGFGRRRPGFRSLSVCAV
jgi:hypothetical protein